MNNETRSTTKLLVVYQLHTSQSPRFYERMVEVPASLPPENIIDTVKQLVRPMRSPDPSDNYQGQHPNDVQIINLINLSALL